MSLDEQRWYERDGEYFCKGCEGQLVALSVTEAFVIPARSAGVAFQCPKCRWSIIVPDEGRGSIL